MEIRQAAARAANRANPDYFTGDVWLDPIAASSPPSRLNAASVTFAPGARTAWHTHPVGQTLLVLSGSGRAQTRGGPARALRPGDVVIFAPGEKHWHGAAPDSMMTHLAMQEAVDGFAADWLEQVEDEDYLAAPEDG